jgi:uncharacterized membrane protein YdbT with pleckstrin-like domain
MPNALANQLKQVPLFAELRRDDLKAVAELAQRAQYAAGSKICYQGRPGLTAYFVESGELRILHVDPQGIEQEVGRLKPGDYFGETSLLLGEPSDATVEVVEDATLLYLNKDDFDPLLDERPSILRSLNMRPEVARKRQARHFKWQEPDEVIILSLHRHNAILVHTLASPVFALVMIVLACGYWFLRTGTTLALTVGAILGAIPLLLIAYLAADHWDDIYIVTTRRVVRRERVPLVRETRIEAPLRTIQNIQESQEGPLAQLFDFGDLIIETAGERGHVAFREVPDPARVRYVIFEQIRRVQAGAKAEERAAIREAMQQHFSLQPEEKQAQEQEPPSSKRRFKLTPPKWLLVPFRVLGYFVPSLRQEHGDTVTWRKHWITLLGPIAPPTLLGIAVTGLAIYLVGQEQISEALVLIIYGTIAVTLFSWWLWKFDDWQNDIYQVTATRIIDVERRPFYLREERREASLSMIQNISLEIHGILGKLLNYGSVTIETAGAGAFTFDYVKDPRGVQAEIFRRVEAFQRQQQQEAAEGRRNELLDWFAVYDQIRHPKTPRVPQPPTPRPSSHQQET